MRRRALWAVGAMLVVGACGGGTASSGAAGSGSAPAPKAAPTRGSSNVIIEAEIAAAGVTNALEAVQRLRPVMLRSRAGGGTSGNPDGDAIVVWVDGVRVGGTDALSSVNALNVKEIRYLSAADATTRFGTGHQMGAIVVTTKK